MVSSLVIQVYATPKQIKVAIKVIDKRYRCSEFITYPSPPLFWNLSLNIYTATVFDTCNTSQLFSNWVERNIKLFANSKTHEDDT